MAMPNYDEFEQRDEFAERGEPGPSRIQAARQRVSTPGMLLIVFGLLGLFLELLCLGAAFTQPTVLYDQIKSMAEKQPQGKERDENLKKIEDAKASMQMNTPTNIASYLFGALLNLLMVLGGASMRKLRGYVMAIIGAICGLIPISGCCCCAMPIGLWAIIVLCNADVKAGFAAVARER
jgi:hypothetical protein